MSWKKDVLIGLYELQKEWFMSHKAVRIVDSLIYYGIYHLHYEDGYHAETVIAGVVSKDVDIQCCYKCKEPLPEDVRLLIQARILEDKLNN